jgi:signal transduction histidine kinase/DNA-binding response OmpR family regulator
LSRTFAGGRGRAKLAGRLRQRRSVALAFVQPRYPNGARKRARIVDRACSRVTMSEPFAGGATMATPRRRHRVLPFALLTGFLVQVAAVLAFSLVAWSGLQRRDELAQASSHALEVQRTLQALATDISDCETGQRGFLLTGDEDYLEPYNRARGELAQRLAALQDLLKAEPDALRRVQRIAELTDAKLKEMNQTIALRRSGNAAEALAMVRTNRGKDVMDDLRAAETAALQVQQAAFVRAQDGWERATNRSFAVALGSALVLLLLIGATAAAMMRDYRAREGQIWIRIGQARLSARLQGEQRLERLGESALQFLAEYLDAQVGALYLLEPDGTFRRCAQFALPAAQRDDELRPGDGLLGQAAKENRVLRIRAVPDGYLAASAVGAAKPAELLILPASQHGIVHAVVELGFLAPVPAEHEELLARVSEQLALSVRAARDRSRLEELLDETQRQSEELQAQQEELRVANEELTEQGRALKESQAQLESQHVELEQTNTQLEEQTQLLERQRDDLVAAQLSLTQKAAELASASEYKSQFLANMSHELRTPLNSTLILARLLADNKPGNLTAEQIKYAQTIVAAGTDLLALINDILDLAKIESGRLEVVVDHVHIERTVEALTKTFAPAAQQAGLKFGATIAPATVDHLSTDSRRLAQILRNLLSNAIKFTPRGEVSLRVSSGDDGVAFAVSDTGVGIALEQQQVIFEAFRQADGSTHRKFGGTGLGLSISRDLARLLGGDIAVRSAPGQGSVFTLTLPFDYVQKAPPSAEEPAPSSMPLPPSLFEPAPEPAALVQVGIEDDRTHLQPGRRVVLIIEDDVRFAEILRDLGRELAFQCVVAHTARDGMNAALRYRPSAILLDINLPDRSGLFVLDELKHNAQLRHVPVHVLSVADHSREALARGAVGYALKPVKREQILEAFQRLDAKLSQAMRRILVVEDDREQRAMVRDLLGGADIEIVEVDTAAKALEQLTRSTFDCAIVDLALPDADGMQLLQRMAESSDVSFPPTIIHTGQPVAPEQEQALRRFSRSIILKGARSPERLLDEVMLFLHRVESNLPPESQRLLAAARSRESAFEDRRILIVEDDVRNIFALSSVLEPLGATIDIARNGREALQALERSRDGAPVDLVLMDIMMPEMDGLAATREIRRRSEWASLPIIALTAKAMRDDRERCLAAGANDYIAKPLDVEKLLSLIRVWIRR